MTPSRPLPSHNQAGASLLELMMVLAITGFALGAIVTFISRSRGDMTRVEATSELVYANQRISENLKTSLDGVTDIVANYGGAPDFSALHAVIRASILASATAPQPVPFSIQPIIQNANMADLTGSSMAGDVGNEFYFVASLSPVSATVYLSTTAATTTIISNPVPPLPQNIQAYVVNIDRLQFGALYLTRGKGALKNGQAPLRLVEWRSQPYAALDNLSQTTGAYLTASCQAMINLGYNIAINDSQVLDTVNSYWTLTSLGVVAPGAAPATFAESSWAYVDEFNLSQGSHRPTPGKDWGQVRGESTHAVVAAPSTLSFAFNNVTTAANPTLLATYSTESRINGAMKVPAYATPDLGGSTFAGFPGGFEVLVVGHPGGREVLMRHVLIMGEADSVSRQKNQFLAMDAQDYLDCTTNY
jgi:hypothetical protein